MSYGVSDCGMNFEWKMFDFTTKDCRRLAAAVAKCPQLRVFRINRSKVSLLDFYHMVCVRDSNGKQHTTLSHRNILSKKTAMPRSTNA